MKVKKMKLKEGWIKRISRFVVGHGFKKFDDLCAS